jgi:hypothetical protein
MTFTIDSMFRALSIVEVTVSPVDTISMDWWIVGMRRIVGDAWVFMWMRWWRWCCGVTATYWTFLKERWGVAFAVVYSGRGLVYDIACLMEWVGRCCGNATTYRTRGHAVTEGDASTAPVGPVVMMFYDIVVTMSDVLW